MATACIPRRHFPRNTRGERRGRYLIIGYIWFLFLFGDEMIPPNRALLHFCRRGSFRDSCIPDTTTWEGASSRSGALWSAGDGLTAFDLGAFGTIHVKHGAGFGWHWPSGVTSICFCYLFAICCYLFFFFFHISSLRRIGHARRLSCGILLEFLECVVWYTCGI